jgi:hypothetical protein
MDKGNASPRRIELRYFLAGQEVDESAFAEALAAAESGERLEVFRLPPRGPARWRLTPAGEQALRREEAGR